MPVFLSALLALHGTAFGSEPLNTGLPDRISADFLAREGFLPFDALSEEEGRRLRAPRNYMLAPIASRIHFNGTPVGPLDRATQRRVFAESTYAMLPPGTRIATSIDALGRAHWNYPVGTTVAHRIALRSEPERIFELRIARKRLDGVWAFGTYSPDDLDDQQPAATLRLENYSSFPAARLRLRPAGATPGTELAVSLNRISLSSCRGCHFANSTADYMYERRQRPDGPLDIPASIAAAGPCDFVPNNPNVTGAWAAAFQSRFGYSPFD